MENTTSSTATSLTATGSGAVALSAEAATRHNFAPAEILPAAKAAFYILLISSAAPPVTPEAAASENSDGQTYETKLRNLQHTVITAASDDWDATLASHAAQVVVLQWAAAADLNTQLQLCRRISERCAERQLPLLVVPSGANDDQMSADAWASWQGAGASALLRDDSSDAEMQAVLEALVQQAQTRRELKALREQLSKQVQNDDLTQLLNRRFFFKAAHRELSRARRYNHPLSCLMVDINYFKLLNTTFGYACGDYVLRTIAGIIRDWTRDSDIVARFGAKKFVILLPETEVQGAMMLREKLQNEVNNRDFLFESQKIPVSISVGEAERQRTAATEAAAEVESTLEAENDGEEYDEVAPLSVREEVAELLEDADAALFVAKRGVRFPSLSPSVGANSTSSPETTGLLGARED